MMIDKLSGLRSRYVVTRARDGVSADLLIFTDDKTSLTSARLFGRPIALGSYHLKGVKGLEPINDWLKRKGFENPTPVSGRWFMRDWTRMYWEKPPRWRWCEASETWDHVWNLVWTKTGESFERKISLPSRLYYTALGQIWEGFHVFKSHTEWVRFTYNERKKAAAKPSETKAVARHLGL